MAESVLEDIFKESGLSQFFERLIKEWAAGNVVDVIFTVLPYIVVGFFIFTVVKSILDGVGKIAMNKGGKNLHTIAGKAGTEIRRNFNSRARPDDESVIDKAQRLIGDGEYQKAIQHLKGYVKSNPSDIQAQALYSNAREWSGIKSQGNRQIAKSAASVPPSRVALPQNKSTPRQTLPPRNNNAGGKTNKRLTKAQMVHFAKTGKLPR